MKNKIKLVFLSFNIALVIISCNKYEIPERTEKALKYAKENREELEEVLSHYARRRKDSLKFQAACYLIENMPGHYAYYTEEIDKYEPILKHIGKRSIGSLNRRALWDSAAPNFHDFDFDKVRQVNDINYIKEDFLIGTIESSFYAWKTYPWCKDLSFDEIKKYILPYRVSNEPLELIREQYQKQYAWVLDSIKNETSMEEAFTLIYNDFYSWFETVGNVSYPISFTYSQIDMAKGGRCEDGCNMLIMILRSLGVKSVYDFSVQWSNRKTAVHSWVAFAKDENNTLYIDNNKRLEKPTHIHSGVFPMDEPGAKHLAEKQFVQQFKKGTKVRRLSLEPNGRSLRFLISNEKDIPSTIDDLFSFDVTTHYIPCADFKIPVKGEMPNPFVYLAVFSRNGLYPVTWGLTKKGEARFNDVGIDGIYFPGHFVNGMFYPISAPFILKEKGSLEYLNIDKDNKQTMVIKRKYPLFVNILNHMNKMFGARIQGANKADFSDAVDLFVLDKTYTMPKDININNSDKFRYLRFLPKANTSGDIAELGFYTFENGKMVKLTGEVLYKQEGHHRQGAEKAFDDNFDSFYMARKKETWIGIDLGNGNAKRIYKIRFSPRSDTNFIIPGNEYELFYWDNNWISMGKMVADDFNLIYNNVPSETLYWLHCHSGGTEERPFTYENGRQVWR